MSSELRDRRYKKPNFITPGGSRLSDLNDEELEETLRLAAQSSLSRKKQHQPPPTIRQQRPGSRPQKPHKKDDSGKVGILFKLTVCQHLLLLIGMIAVAVLSLLIFLPNPIEPVAFKLGPQPPAVGPLATNKRLSEARKMLPGAIMGAESFAFVGDHLFTGTIDGKIVRVNLKTQVQELWVRFGPSNCSATKNFTPKCGRPLGLRRHPTNASRLLVADAYLGLIDVSLESRSFQPLVDRFNPVGVTVFNDVDVTPDGKLAFVSDSSIKFPLHMLMHQVLEGSSNGRLLMLNLTSGQVAPVLEGLSFANGVQLHPDGHSVLVAETTACRITRYYFSGPLAGKSTIFADNLAIMPDNIRLAGDGKHLWVAGTGTRLAGVFSGFDWFSERTWLRQIVAKMVPGPLIHQLTAPRYGLVLKLNLADGSLVESLHDPEGQQLTHSSEVHEYNGNLYFGTYYGSYIASLKL